MENEDRSASCKFGTNYLFKEAYLFILQLIACIHINSIEVVSYDFDTWLANSFQKLLYSCFKGLR